MAEVAARVTWFVASAEMVYCTPFQTKSLGAFLAVALVEVARYDFNYGPGQSCPWRILLWPWLKSLGVTLVALLLKLLGHFSWNSGQSHLSVVAAIGATLVQAVMHSSLACHLLVQVIWVFVYGREHFFFDLGSLRPKFELVHLDQMM